MGMGRWGQEMWLSNRDLCNGMERAVLADDVEFAVLNLMSDNPGMRWDIETTKRVISYAPQDGARAVIDSRVQTVEDEARARHALITYNIGPVWDTNPDDAVA